MVCGCCFFVQNLTVTATLVSLGMAVAVGMEVTASRAFGALALFDSLRNSFLLMPLSIQVRHESLFLQLC